MNKFLTFLALSLLLANCAHRGYDSLSQEVPELFPGFKPENYEKKETPKNIVYFEKVLPQSEKAKEEFHEDEYTIREKPDSYRYYVPKDRVPASLSKNQKLINWPKIRTNISTNKEALLVE